MSNFDFPYTRHWVRASLCLRRKMYRHHQRCFTCSRQRDKPASHSCTRLYNDAQVAQLNDHTARLRCHGHTPRIDPKAKQKATVLNSPRFLRFYTANSSIATASVAPNPSFFLPDSKNSSEWKSSVGSMSLAWALLGLVHFQSIVAEKVRGTANLKGIVSVNVLLLL